MSRPYEHRGLYCSVRLKHDPIGVEVLFYRPSVDGGIDVQRLEQVHHNWEHVPPGQDTAPTWRFSYEEAHTLLAALAAELGLPEGHPQDLAASEASLEGQLREAREALHVERRRVDMILDKVVEP